MYDRNVFQNRGIPNKIEASCVNYQPITSIVEVICRCMTEKYFKLLETFQKIALFLTTRTLKELAWNLTQLGWQN